jgi:hypothetical protein
MRSATASAIARMSALSAVAGFARFLKDPRCEVSTDVIGYRIR